jgi:nicotinate-nucleotide pyrophosphorylase
MTSNDFAAIIQMALEEDIGSGDVTSISILLPRHDSVAGY